MVRAPKIDKNGIKKGAWSEEEDNKLRAYVTRYGHWNWRELPKFAGVSRCGKSCRLRWVNYLQPNIKHGNYTQEEDDLIIKLHKQLGNKWSAIATKLPGRSDNDIKNHWHTRLRKRADPNVIILGNESSGESEYFEPNQHEERSNISSFCTGSNEHQPDVVTSEFKVNEERSESTTDAFAGSSCSTDQLSSLSSNSSGFDWLLDNNVATVESFGDTIDSFWREPFLIDMDISNITDDQYYMVNHFNSPPSPLIGEEFLWAYDNDGFLL